MKKRKPPLPGMLSAAGALACVLLLAACPTDGGDPYNPYGPYQTGISDPYEGKLLILQTYGTGPDTDGAVSHNFVELYNKSEEALDLAGITLQYADGKEGGTAPEDPDWKAISLSGTVPAGHSFLILGKKSNTSGRLQLTDGSGDINDDNFVMNNHAYKAALLRTENAVSAANPFSPKLPGYIDMIGAVNAPDEEDSIDAYETGPLEGIKKHGSARRANLTDTNNNAQDFVYIDYRTTETEEYKKEAYRPRNTAAGQWDPAAPATPPPPPPPTATLMILQAYGHGGKTEPAITHSFVELYNNTAAAIDLASYSLQIADEGNGTSWTAINLSGTIPSYGSYLIRGAVAEDISDSRLNLTPVTPDVDGTFLLSNDEFKIALMSNQTALTVGNPFDTGGGTSAAGYVDMLGAGKANDLTGYETAPVDGISKQRAVRRKHLSDTDNNADDFKTHDYRVSGLSDTDLAKCRPRTAAEGTWTPEFP